MYGGLTGEGFPSAEGTREHEAQNQEVIASYCVHTVCPAPCWGLPVHYFLVFTLAHNIDKKIFFSPLILQDEEVQPQRSCDLPKGYTGKLGYDSTFVWVPVPTRWLSLLERRRDMF